jgi:intein-encoded DNA endonuclease-like protein
MAEITPAILIGVAVATFLLLLIAMGGFGRVLLSQSEKRNAERFAEVEHRLSEEAKRLQELRQDVVRINQTLPSEYVRREDWIRFQAVLETKLDRLFELYNRLSAEKGGTR